MKIAWLLWMIDSYSPSLLFFSNDSKNNIVTYIFIKKKVCRSAQKQNIDNYLKIEKEKRCKMIARSFSLEHTCL